MPERDHHPEPLLTPRERQVLDGIAKGKTNFEIAQSLGISLDGVKWHVREILSRLGVNSREEAAAYWARETGWRRVIPRRVRPLAAPVGLLVSGTAVVGLSLAALWIALSLRGGGTAAVGPPTPVAVTSTPQTATLAVGEVLPFTCSVRTPSRRPTLAEMAETYAVPRFRGVEEALFPALFGLQLSSVDYDFSPTANSGAIEPSNFFRSIPSPAGQCRSATVHNVRLRDYRPIQIEVTSVDPVEARLLVAPEPGMRYDVAFEPRTGPDPKGGVSPAALSRLLVQLESGQVVRDFRLPRYGPEVEYGASGEIVFAEVIDPARPNSLDTAGVTQRLRVLAQAAGAGGGTVEVRDRAGGLLQSISMPIAAHAWQQLALVDLTPEAFTLEFVAGAARLLVVPEATPLPPEVLPLLN